MGLNLKEEVKKLTLDDFAQGDILMLLSGITVMRVNENNVIDRYTDEKVYAINLVNGESVLNPNLTVHEVFENGREIVFEVDHN